MARPGVTPTEIIEIVKQLEAEGVEATVTVVRERLGTGSYSTIGAVLNDWRREQAQAARQNVPEIPEALHRLTRHLWSEAWKSADQLHEPERQAFARGRQEHEKAKQEMTAEIRRLEDELERVAADRESCLAALDKAHRDLETANTELAKATTVTGLLQGEIERLRGEGQKNIEHLTNWIERATKAETQLQKIETSKGDTAKRKQ